MGVEPVVCPPHRPDKKPFVERAIGTLKREWLARHAPTTLADAIAVLEPFIAYHNTQRPHQGAACHNRIPDDAFPPMSQPTLPRLPASLRPNAWLQAEHGRVFRRRVSANGSIQIDSHTYYIGHAFTGLPVLAQLVAPTAQLIITHNGAILRLVALKGLYPDTLRLVDYVERLQAEARSIEHFRQVHWEQTSDVL